MAVFSSPSWCPPWFLHPLLAYVKLKPEPEPTLTEQIVGESGIFETLGDLEGELESIGQIGNVLGGGGMMGIWKTLLNRRNGSQLDMAMELEWRTLWLWRSSWETTDKLQQDLLGGMWKTWS